MPKKHKGKPQGMTYADELARKRAVAAGIERFAADMALTRERKSCTWKRGKLP